MIRSLEVTLFELVISPVTVVELDGEVSTDEDTFNIESCQIKCPQKYIRKVQFTGICARDVHLNKTIPTITIHF